MATIKKIFCTVDLVDEHAPTVADYAATLAKAFDGEVVVLYVQPSLNTVMIDMAMADQNIEIMVEQLLKASEVTMANFLKANFSDVKVKSIVKAGDPAIEILDLSAEEKADIIVMGTRALKGVKRILYGSVAEKVTKNANIPVITITPQV